MMFNRFIFIIASLLFINACEYVPKLDEVIPDRRTEYKKSEPLPDLEVPPDLTTDAQNDPLAIPDEEATTLSEFERQKNLRRGGSVSGAGGVDALADEQWLSVPGNTVEIWPKLREFWIAKGYSMELDDAELGVLETSWLETGSEGITTFRDRFKIISEPGENPGNTVLFITNERQEKTVTGDNDAEWVAIGKNSDLEKQIAGELNLHFYGTAPPSDTAGRSSRTSTASIPSAPAKRAEMLNLGEDKVYLSLPEEFTQAWRLTEDALLKAGFFIENQDRSKGLYYVLFYENTEEEKGLLSKLAFWKDDESEGKEYQINLTGVGDKTELVVLDEKGEWAESQDATKILTLLQAQYNSAAAR